MKKALYGLALTVALTATPTLADNTGFMLGGGVYYSGVDADATFEDIQPPDFEPELLKAVFDDHSVAFNVAAGWRFNDWIAVDAGYWDLGEFDTDIELLNQALDEVRTDTTAWTAGAIVSVPVWLVDIYGRVGMAWWEAESRRLDEDGNDPYYGIGASLNIGGSFDIYAEWLRFDFDAEVDTIGAGIRYTF